MVSSQALGDIFTLVGVMLIITIFGIWFLDWYYDSRYVDREEEQITIGIHDLDAEEKESLFTPFR